MKIVQVNTVCGSGSVGRIVVDLYQIAEKAGMECLAAYGRGSAPSGMNAYLIGNRPDFYCHVMRNFFKGESGFGSRKTTARFIEWLNTENPDVIHLHNIHGFYLQVEELFAYLKETNRKVVWTLHDCWAFTGHCAYFDYADCDKWKSGCQDCAQHVKAYPYAIFKDNSKQAYYNKKAAFTGVKHLTIVTPSRWLAQLVKQSFLGEYPVKVIPNGIDLTQFKPTELTMAESAADKKIVLGVANIWEPRKGLDYFEKLAESLPDNYQIMIVGVNAAQKRRLAHKYRSDRLWAMERTANVEALAALYTRADVYVNLTLEDNFPTTNLEALACGTPVVTFDTGGSCESLDDSCGRVVPKRDMDKLVSAIRQLAEADKPIEACIQRAQSFDKEKRFGEYLQLYHQGENGGNESAMV
jgi:glycosyltransferase involved in cell wall biosynthesis